MPREGNIYIIDPEETDPKLIRDLMPLGETPESGPRSRRSSKRRARRGAVIVDSRFVEAPTRSARFLVLAYVLGPGSVLATQRSRCSRFARTATLTAVLGAASAAVICGTVPNVLGPGDAALLVQAGTAAGAVAVWLGVWAAGLLAVGRGFGAGPWARAGARRPVPAGILGLLAPGLGLMLTGHTRRAVATMLVVGPALVAAVALSRSAIWWSWHLQTAAPILTNRQLELSFLVLGAMVGGGLVVWLISALEGARLALGPRVVRRISGVDRVPAALLLTLIAFGVFFRPASMASELDRITGSLVADGFRTIPLWTARVATVLAPDEPTYEVRLAERHEDLGHGARAAEIRERLAGRWQRYERLVSVREGTAPRRDPS